MTNRVAVVTGGAQGIGRATAAALHREGATVLVSDIDGVRAKECSEELGLAGAIACDVRDEQQVASMIEEVVRDRGRIDVLVANAGIGSVAPPVIQMPLERWRNTVSVNLDGVFLSIKHAGAQMVQQGAGTIITLASITAQNGWPLLADYAAAKAGVISLTKTAALELRPFGVRVNAVCPGFIETQMVNLAKSDLEKALGQDFDALIIEKQGRYGTVEDIADLIAYLASDRAAWISGSAYVADNGFTASNL